MTIHDVIRTAIGSLVGQRVYPNRFPQESGAPTWPAIRSTVISRENDPTLCGGYDFDTDTIRVQLDICATTYEQVEPLARSVIAAMEAMDIPTTRQEGGFETWDAEARVHRIAVDFLLLQSSNP